MNLPKIIAVDFDGTLCEECYPGIGRPRYDVIRDLLEEQKNGAKIILNTCRAGTYLDDAIRWCQNLGIRFDAINDNVVEILQLYPYSSRKLSADEYWDDKCVLLASANWIDDHGTFVCSRCNERYDGDIINLGKIKRCPNCGAIINYE